MLHDDNLNNGDRLLVKIYEETARHNILAARDSDLRAGGERVSALAADIRPFDLWYEAAIGAMLAVLWGTGLSKLIPEGFGLFVSAALNGCGATEALDTAEGRDFGAALLGALLLGAVVGWRWRGHSRRTQALQRVKAALQRVRELYNVHSARSARLQEAGHHRVQVEAWMHPFAGMGWRQIEEVGGTELMRRYMNTLAEIDSRRVLDEAEFERAGGDYWLELLRAGLRGDLPLVICLYAADGLTGTKKCSQGEVAARVRRRATALCATEREVFGEASAQKALAYRALEGELLRVRGSSIAELDALLGAWGAHHPLPVQPETRARRVFDRVFCRSR